MNLRCFEKKYKAMLLKNTKVISTVSKAIQRKASQRQQRIRKISLGLAGLGLISLIGGVLIANSLSNTPFLKQQLSSTEAAVFRQNESFSRSNLQVPVISKPVNILVLGIKTNLSDIKNSDDKERKKTGYDAVINSLDGLSDTMMLFRFDPNTNKVIVFGIPRDTKVEVDGKIEKINAIDHERGIAQAAKVVSNTLNGVQIDRYIRLNNFGLEKLIDSLNGLNVTVLKDIKYQDDSQHFYVNFKAGKQHFDGHKLLSFLRFRHDANGDVGRMQRQQMVIRSMLEQWSNPSTVAKIPELMSIVNESVDTNLSIEETIAIGGFALNRGTSKDRLQMLMMPGEYNGDGKHGISYWLPDSIGIQNMMAKYFDTGQVQNTIKSANNLRIRVQDTGYYPDATKRLIAKLKKAGYENVQLDKDPKVLKENLDITQIIAQKGELLASQDVANSLGVGKAEINTAGNLYSDITIKVGKDWSEFQRNEGHK
jgi:polyisoprenyl-teichoic acid--peptidoglycan teichoic acid transferase